MGGVRHVLGGKISGLKICIGIGKNVSSRGRIVLGEEGNFCMCVWGEFQLAAGFVAGGVGGVQASDRFF